MDILYPGVATGILAHSNQAKLVAFPMDSIGDTVRYHLVYFRTNPITNKSTVYYRCSRPVYKDSPDENINWIGDELPLSQVVYDSLDSPYRTLINPDCDYPSLVVRPDSNQIKVYIVYSCQDPVAAYSNHGLIVESVIKLDTTPGSHMPIFANYYGNNLSYYTTGPNKNRKEFGNPVVSGVAGGNIYAFSDSASSTNSHSRIISAWKAPGSKYFSYRDTTIFYWAWGVFPNLKYLTNYRHPSLNTYSRLDTNEDNCSLAYQANTGSQNEIFYTRLRKTALGLQHYLPTTQVQFLRTGLTETFLNIARLTDFQKISSNDNTYPFVIRSLEDFPNVPDSHPNRFDFVVWQSKVVLSGYPNYPSVTLRQIGLFDSNHVPLKYIIRPPVSYFDVNYGLVQPNIANTYFIYNDG